MVQRLQRKRTKGSHLPPGTMCVTRPGKYGNPYPTARAYAAALAMLEPEQLQAFLAPLRGKNLACYCGPEQDCHADVLLRLANS